MKKGSFIDSLPEMASTVYSAEEEKNIKLHILSAFGIYTNIFQEVMASDLRVDICVIPPSSEREYYTLVTVGMGACKMKVPQEYRNLGVERAELMITLPPEWKLLNNENKWNWPIHLLKSLARIPIQHDTWLGYGHIVDNGKPYCEETKLCGSLLVTPQKNQNELNEAGNICRLPNGEQVHFYHVIPLYRNEINVEKVVGVELLLDMFLSELPHVVDPQRKDTCSDGIATKSVEDIPMTEDTDATAEELEDFDLSDFGAQNAPIAMLDDAHMHLSKIRLKKLPVNELNAYNHIAAFLRWGFEKKLLNIFFMIRFAKELEQLAEKGFGSDFDFRKVLRDSEEVNGCLLNAFFDEEGAIFAGYYYQKASSRYFPLDVDTFAERYFQEHPVAFCCSEQDFEDEKYLFVPFDEAYYYGLKKYMDRAYKEWRAFYFYDKEGYVN